MALSTQTKEVSNATRLTEVFLNHDFASLARDLVSQGNIGYILLRRAVRPEFLEKLEVALREDTIQGSLEDEYRPDRKDPSRFYQVTVFPGPAEDGRNAGPGWRHIIDTTSPVMVLAQAYTKFVHNVMAQTLNLEQAPLVDDIRVNRYLPNEGLMSYHQDPEPFVAPSGIVTVKGRATFRVSPPKQIIVECTTWEGIPTSRIGAEPDIEREIVFTTLPGDLILILGRMTGEDRRPFHQVENLDEERYSVVFGHHTFDRK